MVDRELFVLWWMGDGEEEVGIIMEAKQSSPNVLNLRSTRRGSTLPYDNTTPFFPPFNPLLRLRTSMHPPDTLRVMGFASDNNSPTTRRNCHFFGRNKSKSIPLSQRAWLDSVKRSHRETRWGSEAKVVRRASISVPRN